MWTRVQLSARNPKNETKKEIWTQLQLNAPNPEFKTKKIKTSKSQTLKATTNYFKVMKPIGCYFRVWGTFCVGPTLLTT
jgi:hypothetical protein